MTVNGPFTLSGGSFTATTGTTSIAGALTHTAGGTFGPNGGTVALTSGTATIDVATTETFNNLTFTAGAKTVAAGTTLTSAGLPHADSRQSQHRHPRRARPGQRGSRLRRRHRHAPAGWVRSTDRHGCGDHRLGQSAARRHRQAIWHADAGRHPADLPTWTYTSGTVDPGTSTVVFAGGP